MRNLTTRSIAAVALATTLGLSAPVAAFAASTKASPATSTATKTTAMDQLAWKTWHVSWMTYILKVRSINLNFRTSVEKARAAFTTSLRSATTTADRTNARTNFNAALALAITARVTAITAAGNPPTPPAGYNGTAYVTSIQAANIAFRVALAAAQSTYAQALMSATTEQERSAARTALRIARNNAITARANALTALGTPPLQPGKKIS